MGAHRPGQQGHRGWCGHEPSSARDSRSISCTAGYAGARGSCACLAIMHAEEQKLGRVHQARQGQSQEWSCDNGIGPLRALPLPRTQKHLGETPEPRGTALVLVPQDRSPERGSSPIRVTILSRPLAPNTVPSSQQQAGLWPVPSPSRLKQPTDHASTTFRLMPPAAWQGPKERAANARARSHARTE